jgi:signal transduction histidine kinase
MYAEGYEFANDAEAVTAARQVSSMPSLRSLCRIWDAEAAGGASVRARLVSVLVRPTPPPLVLGLVLAAALMVAETLLLYPLKQVAPVSNLLVVYLLGVMVVATFWGLGLTVATAAASVLVFDFFHTAPLYKISLNTPEDHTALITFLVVGLLTSVLAKLARSRAALAHQRQKEAHSAAERARVLAEQQAALRRVATVVARGVSPAEVFAVVAEETARCLDVDGAEVFRYEADGAATVVGSDSRPGVPGIAVGERLTLEGGDNVAAMVLRTGRTARMDCYEGASGPLAARVRAAGLRSRVGAPIVVEERVWGMVVIGSSRPEPLPPDTEERISDFAELVATALANAATRGELIASRARIVAAADDARRRLERDLHDGAQQRAVSLGLRARMAEGLVLREQTELKQELLDLASGLTGLSTELQEISRGIHPAILSEGGLGPALKALAHRSMVPVSFEVAIERRLSDAVEIAAYYVVAEALTNAAKHAHASQVNVRAETTDATLRMSIQDDGIGGADARKGSGLIGLKDRVEAVGGQMRVTSPPGRGTLLHITIPLDSQSTR